jgi:hypothetical protein
MAERKNVSGQYEVKVNGTTVFVLTSDGLTATALTSDGAVAGASLAVSGASVVFAALPTADPEVAGRLWIDAAANRVIKVSAGA